MKNRKPKQQKIEGIKKIEILELKSTINKINSSMDDLNSSIKEIKRITEPEDIMKVT